MKVFFHDDCLCHNPPFEILSGNLVPYFESPSRVQLIKETLETSSSGQFDLCNELDFNLDVKECCLRIHTADYLHYLETAYDDWVKAGGDVIRLPFYRRLIFSTLPLQVAVLPDTFPRPSLLFGKPKDPSKLHPIARAG